MKYSEVGKKGNHVLKRQRNKRRKEVSLVSILIISNLILGFYILNHPTIQEILNEFFGR